MTDSQLGRGPRSMGDHSQSEPLSQSQVTARQIAEWAVADLAVQGCIVCAFDYARGRVRLLASHGSGLGAECVCDEHHGWEAAAASHGVEPGDPPTAFSVDHAVCPPLSSPIGRLSLPLYVGGKPAGIMQLLDKTERRLTLAEQQLTRRQAASAALALENARMYDRAAALFSLAQTLSGTLQLGQVGNLISEAVAKAMGVKGATVRSLDRIARRLDVVGSYGLSAKYVWEKGPVIAEESIRDALDGKPTSIRDVTDDPRVQYPAAAVEEGIRSIVSVPMVVKGVVTGVLRIYSARPFEFTPDDAAFLAAAAEVAGAAVENARLYDGIRHDFDVLMDEIVFMRRAARAVGGSKEA
ncbi:MAG: GAF domain-containing protein [Chloroflexota bacterium]